MGTAIAWPLADNGHSVRLVGTHLDKEIIASCLRQRHHPRLRKAIPATVEFYFVGDLAAALFGADIVVSGVNSFGVRWIGRTVGPHLRPGQLLVGLTKGLEVADNGDLRIMPDVLAGELPATVRGEVGLAAIGGPCIAGELASRRPSCVVLGSRDAGAAEQLAAAFRTSYYHVWTTTDLAGLEVCAALKNAYAISVGMVHGRAEQADRRDTSGARMHNLAAAVFAQACREMDRVLQVVGATRSFAFELPGAGDLYVTAQGGRNLRLGRLLGLGHSYAEARAVMAGETLEGAETVRAVSQALPKLQARGLVAPEELPLMRALARVVVGGQATDLALEGFFGQGGTLARRSRAES